MIFLVILLFLLAVFIGIGLSYKRCPTCNENNEPLYGGTEYTTYRCKKCDKLYTLKK